MLTPSDYDMIQNTASHGPRFQNTSRRKLTLLAVAAVVGLAGITLWAATSAATVTLSAEAENGAPTGNAAPATIAGASGSSAVRFASGGGTGAFSCDQAGVQQLVNSVSQSSIDTLMREIVQDDTKPKPNQLISRHVSSPGNKQKTDWARAKFTSWGLNDVSQNFTSDGYSLTNSIGRINGTTTPNTIYGAGGHIDSISENPKTLAPGADDDASGTVMAMEAGRVLVKFKHCLKSTLDFVGFNDEEENMKGSEVYVNSVKSSAGKSMKGFYNADMVGYTKGADCLKSDSNLSVDTALAKKIVDMNSKYGVGVNVTTGKYSVDDIDNSSFWSANLPSVYLVDCATEVDADVYPNYHSTKDTVTASNISMTQITKLTKLVVAAMAEYGMQ